MRLINADRLKEEIVEAGQGSTRYRIGKFWELNRNEIQKVIDEQPTVEERKKGYWYTIERGEHGYSAGSFRCSVCGEPNRSYNPKPNFCGNCGADMREENES